MRCITYLQRYIWASDHFPWQQISAVLSVYEEQKRKWVAALEDFNKVSLKRKADAKGDVSFAFPATFSLHCAGQNHSRASYIIADVLLWGLVRSRYGVARGHGVCSNLDRLLRERSCCTWSGECGKCIESSSIELNTVRCGCIVRRCNVRLYPRARSARSLLRSAPCFFVPHCSLVSYLSFAVHLLSSCISLLCMSPMWPRCVFIVLDISSPYAINASLGLVCTPDTSQRILFLRGERRICSTKLVEIWSFAAQKEQV